jgi:hypothetical protein
MNYSSTIYSIDMKAKTITITITVKNRVQSDRTLSALRGLPGAAWNSPVCPFSASSGPSVVRLPLMTCMVCSWSIDICLSLILSPIPIIQE